MRWRDRLAPYLCGLPVNLTFAFFIGAIVGLGAWFVSDEYPALRSAEVSEYFSNLITEHGDVARSVGEYVPVCCPPPKHQPYLTALNTRDNVRRNDGPCPLGFILWPQNKWGLVCTEILKCGWSSNGCSSGREIQPVDVLNQLARGSHPAVLEGKVKLISNRLPVSPYRAPLDSIRREQHERALHGHKLLTAYLIGFDHLAQLPSSNVGIHCDDPYASDFENWFPFRKPVEAFLFAGFGLGIACYGWCRFRWDQIGPRLGVSLVVVGMALWVVAMFTWTAYQTDSSIKQLLDCSDVIQDPLCKPALVLIHLRGRLTFALGPADSLHAVKFSLRALLCDQVPPSAQSGVSA